MTNIRARFTTLVGAARPFVCLLVAAGRFIRQFLAWFFAAAFGRWSWQAPPWMGKAHAASDRILSFTPKSDWPVDGHFNVKLAKKGVIAEHVILEEYAFAVKSQPFAARIADSQFYQDQRDPNMKKLVATVSFSHPVDAQSFERLVSLAVQKDADYLGLSPDSRHFSVVYDKLKLNAFIHSAALGMPKDDTPACRRQGRARRQRRQRNRRSAAGGRDDPRSRQPALF
jgi:hypothetical protein